MVEGSSDPEPVASPPPAVEMRGIVKRFGDLVANAEIDFAVDPGEVHALLGENGAGKTTLMRILYGLTASDSGAIYVGGEPVDIRSPKDAIDAGIGMVTQHFSLVEPMTVAENIALGRTRGLRLDLDGAAAQVERASGRFGMKVDPAAFVRQLSVGQRQRVEILKALTRDCRVLILDEPTAVLVPQEADALFDAVRRFRDEGMAVVFISHKLGEVMAISDRITVLRRGTVAGRVRCRDTTQRELAGMMVGRSLTESVTAARPGAGEVVLQVTDLSARGSGGKLVVKDVTFEVMGGELLGVAGVSGNGQSELVEMLTGMRAPSDGSISIRGRDVTGAAPAEMVAAGMGRIPEDRRSILIPDLSVAVNLALEHIDSFRKGAVLDDKAIRAYALELIDHYSIKANPDDPLRNLSGGNMQKVLLARVLARHPKVIVAAQPTRGLDVGATEEVRRRLIEQRDAGAAVVLVSEDLDEILHLSDRVIVMYEGEIAGEADPRAASAERMGLLMSGVGGRK